MYEPTGPPCYRSFSEPSEGCLREERAPRRAGRHAGAGALLTPLALLHAIYSTHAIWGEAKAAPDEVAKGLIASV